MTMTTTAMDTKILLNIGRDMVDVSKALQLHHVLRGVEGYCELVFPHLANRIVPLSHGKIKHGDTIARIVFKAFRMKARRLANEHRMSLYEKRDLLSAVDDVDALDQINADIVYLTSAIDNYDELFGQEECVLFQRCLLSLLRQRLESYKMQQEREEGAPSTKRPRK